MSFIANPSPTPESEIASGPFWPSVDPERIRKEQRIDESVPAERLRATVIVAIAHANDDLRDWRNRQLDNGISTLEAATVDEIDGKNLLVTRYLWAIGCETKALLLERTRDFDTTGNGDKRADTLEPQIDQHRRDYRNAISDIQGKSRNVVELI